MDETVAVALIAVGGTLASGGLSYLASHRNTKVQLAGVELEVKKLRSTQAETARQERKSIYVEYLDRAERVELEVRGWVDSEISRVSLAKSMSEYKHVENKLQLVGTPPVIAAVTEFGNQIAAWFRRVADAIEEVGGHDPSVKLPLGVSMAALFDDDEASNWQRLHQRVLDAMRADIDPQPN